MHSVVRTINDHQLVYLLGSQGYSMVSRDCGGTWTVILHQKNILSLKP